MMKELDSKCVIGLTAEHLGLSDLLQCVTCFKHYFDGHLIEYLVLIVRFLAYIHDCLDAPDESFLISPCIYDMRHLLYGAPVYEYALSRFTCVFSKFYMKITSNDLYALLFFCIQSQTCRILSIERRLLISVLQQRGDWYSSFKANE